MKYDHSMFAMGQRAAKREPAASVADVVAKLRKSGSPGAREWLRGFASVPVEKRCA